MLVERIEHKWLAAFARTFTLCQVQPGEVVAIWPKPNPAE